MNATSKTKFSWDKQPPVFTQIDWNNPINKGLMFKVPLNEGRGQTVYDLVAKRKGVFHNPNQALGSTVSWANTPKGKAVNFVDSHGQINFGEQPALTVNLPRLSISAWIYPRSMPTEMQIVSTMHPSQFNYGWVFITFADGSLCFFRNRPGQELNFTSAAGSLIVNRWYHVAVTQNGPGEPAHLYINGKEVSYQTTNLGTLSGWEDSIAQIVTIGGRSPDGHDFDGYINNVAIWNRALTPQEVRALYTHPQIGLIQKETINIFAETIVEETVTSSVSISGKARIQNSSNTIISGVARISRSENVIQTGKARITSQGAITQTGVARIYKPNGLYNGLLSHWKLDESSGTRNDSHSSRHLAEMGGTVGSQTGKIGNAAHFDAASEYLEVANDSELQLGSGKSFSGAGWFYYDSSPSGAHILGKWHVSGLEWLLYRNGANALEFHVTQDGATAFSCFVVSDTVPSLNTWYFVNWWFDVSTGRAYIQINNGAVSQSAATISHVYAGTSPLFVGIAFSTATPNMRGRIDSVSLWNRVLTSDERAALYNSGNGLDYEDFGDVETTSSIYQSGIARITKINNTLNQQGLARIQKSQALNQSGKARISRSESVFLSGKARVSRSEQAIQIGKARIQKSQVLNQLGKARVQKTGSIAQVGKARIQKAEQLTQTGVARIQKTSSLYQTGKALILELGFTSRSVFLSGKASIHKTSSLTQVGVARIAKTNSVSISGRARILTQSTLIQTGIARIQKSEAVTITGQARISRSGAVNIQGVARISSGGVSIFQSGIARIKRTETTSIQGVARITRSESVSISGKAYITRALSATIQGVARIQKTESVTISGKASIHKTSSLLQQGVARIVAEKSVFISGKAKIANTTTISITGKANISNPSQRVYAITLFGRANERGATSSSTTRANTFVIDSPTKTSVNM